MNISQDTFNKCVTIILFAYFLTMYTISYFTGKPLNIDSAIALAVPTFNHVIHQITQTQVLTKNIAATQATKVASIQQNGGSHLEVQ